jgi:hypothetical protein
MDKMVLSRQSAPQVKHNLLRIQLCSVRRDKLAVEAALEKLGGIVRAEKKRIRNELRASKDLKKLET